MYHYISRHQFSPYFSSGKYAIPQGKIRPSQDKKDSAKAVFFRASGGYSCIGDYRVFLVSIESYDP